MKKLFSLAALAFVSSLGLSAMATSAQAQMFSAGGCGSGFCGGMRVASPPPGYGSGHAHRGGSKGQRQPCPQGSVASDEAGGCVRVLTEAELSRIPPKRSDPRCVNGVEGYWTREGGMDLHHKCVYRR